MRVALAAAGDVDEDAMRCAEDILTTTFGVETARLEPLSDPAYAWDEKRRQYSSTLILHDARNRVPEDAVRLLVVTRRDLFIPMLSFVYGQAQLNAEAAVLSLARLDQAFYGLPPNPTLLHHRIRKETIHEIGHSLGLVHCSNRQCAMALSTNIQQLDAKGDDLCDGCHALAAESLRSLAETAVATAGRPT